MSIRMSALMPSPCRPRTRGVQARAGGGLSHLRAASSPPHGGTWASFSFPSGATIKTPPLVALCPAAPRLAQPGHPRVADRKWRGALVAGAHAQPPLPPAGCWRLHRGRAFALAREDAHGEGEAHATTRTPKSPGAGANFSDKFYRAPLERLPDRRAGRARVRGKLGARHDRADPSSVRRSWQPKLQLTGWTSAIAPMAGGATPPPARPEHLWHRYRSDLGREMTTGYYALANYRWNKYNDFGVLYDWTGIPAWHGHHGPRSPPIFTRQFLETDSARLQLTRATAPCQLHRAWLQMVWGLAAHPPVKSSPGLPGERTYQKECVEGALGIRSAMQRVTVRRRIKRASLLPTSSTQPMLKGREKMRIPIASVIIALIAASLLAPASPSGRRGRGRRHHPELAAIAREVGGSKVRVSSIAQPNQDYHKVDARPSDVARPEPGRRSRARWHGFRPLGGCPRSPPRASKKVAVGGPGYVDASQRIKRLEVPTEKITGASGDIHATGNPHYYYDPGCAKVIAHNILLGLRRVSPSDPASSMPTTRSSSRRLMPPCPGGSGRWRSARASRWSPTTKTGATS